MTDFGIKVDLLSRHAKDTLADLGAELHPSAITFCRRLSAAEMRTVLRILKDLEAQTGDEQNHISFALGDWAIQANEWFDGEVVQSWIAEETRLRAYRDYLLRLMGVTLIRLQFLESDIKECCAFLALKGVKLTPSDVLSPDPKRRKYTLGQMLYALRKTQALDSGFDSFLSAFVEKRNRFIHRFWTELSVDVDISGLPFGEATEEILRNIEEFISGLLREVDKLDRVFLGLRYSLGKVWYVAGQEIAERENRRQDFESHPLVANWAEWEERLGRYEGDFLSALRGTGEVSQES